MSEIQLLEDVIPDYHVYDMKKGEFILNVIVAQAVLTFVLYLFYGYWIAGIVGIPLAIYWPKLRKASIIRKRSERLTGQFKELLYALSSSMQAGRSIESAFQSIYGDLELLYPDEDTEIMCELRNIIANLGANVPLEDIMGDFAARSHDEEIETFVDIYVTSKRMGGDLVGVMRSTSDTIAEKVEVRQDIAVAIASAKFEQTVLMFVPIGVILMIRGMAPEYLGSIYGDPVGIILSTLSLVLLGVAIVIGNRITDIKV